MNSPDPNSTVSSPCVKVCQLNERDVCLGCGRTLEEIGAWSRVDNIEKQSILERAAARLPLSNPG